MANAPHAAFTFYVSGLLVLTAAIHIGATQPQSPVGPLQRALARGEVRPGIPRLGPDDPMANAALLQAELDEVPHPLAAPSPPPACGARARTFAVMLAGRLSRVRFAARTVCQLRRLKEISMAQEAGPTAHGTGLHGRAGAGGRPLGEVAAFVVGRRLPGGDDVDVTRVVVPPFRFTEDSLTFVPADLGPLEKGEQMIGTYHTHPDGDLEQGVLSDIDLSYMMRTGYIDFHGQVGPLRSPRGGLDWLFDIVEPRDGEWNVYAHDPARLLDLLRRCETETVCPLNELRLAGSPYYLLTRHYEERDEGL